MKQIAVINTDAILGRKIGYHCGKAAPDFTLEFLVDESSALEFLNYELPEIVVINFSDAEIRAPAVVQAISADPWLHYGGVVALHTSGSGKALEAVLKGLNVISLITRPAFDTNFPRLLRILSQNRQILFQRVFQEKLLGSVSGSFVIDNDPFDVKAYASLLSTYLFNCTYIDRERQERLLVALLELLVNAVEHGNCRISFQEKNAWLEAGKDIFDLMRRKNADPEVARRKVYLSYTVTPGQSHFTIRDEGDGFDWRKRKAGIEEQYALAAHGRGILMANHYVQNLTYNEKGNEVSFECEHSGSGNRSLPGAFQDQAVMDFEDGQVVFEEGEQSNYLYFIVSGKFRVLARGHEVASLTPDDIFLGEMSFLLNDRRSATVVASGQGSLLRISKAAFVNAIRQSPHYGIFLSRLLAQRIDRQNRLLNSTSTPAASA
jgi:anti-sigma regulatory factor (Ser/Thr protein kinase)